MTIIDLFHKETEMLSVSQQIKKKNAIRISEGEKRNRYIPKNYFLCRRLKGSRCLVNNLCLYEIARYLEACIQPIQASLGQLECKHVFPQRQTHYIIFSYSHGEYTTDKIDLLLDNIVPDLQ